MTISKLCWDENKDIYTKILHHPFNTELAQGILDKQIFAYYIEQDSKYLQYFSKALAIIATKLQEEDSLLFLQFALESIVTERKVIHTHFKDFFSITYTNTVSTAMIGYTKDLIATAYEQPVEVAMAFVLPCFWVYYELGVYMNQSDNTNNPYRTWIETYSAEEFKNCLMKAIAITDRYAENTTPHIQKEMHCAFSRACIWEYKFWNDAYIMNNFASL